MEKEKPYQIVRKGAQEYVVVSCPNGHQSQGQKVGDAQIRQTVTCANETCNSTWEEVMPGVNGLEAVQ